ncbi:interleukin-17 receptor E [Protopterus annectens]|uniref:interleukin-17 receptor E n=1 Tax=Protopterus annectens TaxID=7888 RepID=UPI001CFA9D90|nr:interleukin-17 receptor E [Protopterus annectens]
MGLVAPGLLLYLVSALCHSGGALRLSQQTQPHVSCLPRMGQDELSTSKPDGTGDAYTNYVAQPGQEGPVVTKSDRLITNFNYTIRRECRKNKKKKLPVGVDLQHFPLSLSVIHLCLATADCQPCIRVCAKLYKAGRLQLRGIRIEFLQLSTNNHYSLRLCSETKAQNDDSWEIQYDCFPADAGHEVIVSLSTIPDYGVQVCRNHTVDEHETDPVFNYSFSLMKKTVSVSVLPGPSVTARLCYQQAFTCEQLGNQSYQQIDTSHSLSAVLSYEFLLPCLCLEVYYSKQDSSRKQVFPFSETEEAYNADLWRSSRFTDWSDEFKDQMKVDFSWPCSRLKPSVSLCWKENEHFDSACLDIANSSVVASGMTYFIDSVDVHPRMCFKFAYRNSSHVWCPNRRDWSVDVEVGVFQLVLQFKSYIPASFSATLCSKNGHDCNSTYLIHTVTKHSTSDTENIELILPFQALGSCVQVWRSDVLFSGKHIICPNYDHGRLGLLVLASLSATVFIIMLLLLLKRCITRIISAPPWRRTILLIYSPDSEEHNILIGAFADFLRVELCCDVILDLWDTGKVAQIGIIPWLYGKRELVERESGKVLLVWTKFSKVLFEQWLTMKLSCGSCHSDPHDLFSTAMACLQSDLKQGDRSKDYFLIYFEGLCEINDIPDSFHTIAKFKLLKDLPDLVCKLQNPAELSCWLKFVIKFFVRRIAQSERSKNLRRRVELSRVRQQSGTQWEEDAAELELISSDVSLIDQSTSSSL